MPPKTKFSREDIVNAAFELTREKGIEKITARDIAETGCMSTRPMFNYFYSIDKLRGAVLEIAKELFDEYIEDGLKYSVPFLGFMSEYIQFAKDEPMLYKALFISKVDEKKPSTIAAMEQSKAALRKSLMRTYKMDADTADCYFRDMWLVVNSLATLIVTDSNPYADWQINAILTEFSLSLCMAAKNIKGFANGNYDRDAILSELVARKHMANAKAEIKAQRTKINDIPAIIAGEPSDKAFLYIHGKMGYKEEAYNFAQYACPQGYQVIAIDLPEHGNRKNSKEKLLPWMAAPEIKRTYELLSERYSSISVCAVSIGAWFSMLALQDKKIDKAMFISPIVDMEKLICTMMEWAGVTEEELAERIKIPTDFGETLNWNYLSWVRKNSYKWDKPTDIIYGGKDNMTPRETIEKISKSCATTLTIMEKGEHWFHTPEQMKVLNRWMKANVQGSIYDN